MKIDQAYMDQWFDNQLPEIKKTLERLVKIPSVKGKAEPGAPFGKVPRAALNEGIAICSEMGFDTNVVADVAGEATVPGAGEAGLGILAHLDVVPAGPGWTMEPYALTEKDGKWFGRGSIDDKGPFVASLFALHFLKESGAEFKENVRLIFGTDEENGSEDMEIYAQHRAFPKRVFTPDGEFPLINIEKGRFCPKIGADFAEKQTTGVLEMTGGEISNAVPGFATALIAGVDEKDLQAAAEKKPGGCTFEWEEKPNGFFITAHGVNAHASTPEKGINALKGMLTFVLLLPVPEEQKEKTEALLRLFPVGDCFGKGAGVAASDESGPLTAALSQMDWNENGFTSTTDIRFPMCQSCAYLTDTLTESAAKAGLIFREGKGAEPHAVASDSPFVQTLLKAYREETGIDGKPLAIGGGTYVHEIPGGVAFGAEHPGWDYHMHGADEFVPIDQLIQTAKIYVRAINALCCA